MLSVNSEVPPAWRESRICARSRVPQKLLSSKSLQQTFFTSSRLGASSDEYAYNKEKIPEFVPSGEDRRQLIQGDCN
jgi:hypothetical protein